MSTKWSLETPGAKEGSKPDFATLLKDEQRLMLLRGKNIFGDFVYCYLKVSYPDLKRLKEVLNTSEEGSFNLNDYGEIVAAGKGEPPPDVKAEIALMFPSMGMADAGAAANSDSSTGDTSGSSSAPKPMEKKNWDEY